MSRFADLAIFLFVVFILQGMLKRMLNSVLVVASFFVSNLL